MLFRCLHPMELDTGPWTRKSSILCSLLLLLATFSVLQVTGKDETVGLGKHTLLKDGKVILNTSKDYNYVAVKKSIDLNKHKILFPDSCDVTIKDGFIELKYEGKLCTVDLLSDNNDMIEFKAGVRNKAGQSDCLGGPLRIDSYTNVLPFIYSRNNEEIEKFSITGPKVVDKSCVQDKCIGGNCLNWTSLEISWYKRNDGLLVAYTHLIRDVDKGIAKHSSKENKKETTLDLVIEAEKIKIKEEDDILYPKNAVCASKDNPIAKPVAWTINNTLLKDEYLLVFSLLPTSVSKVFSGSSILDKPIPPKPSCELFIQFNTTYYRLLSAMPTPTCTATSTQTTTSTTEAPSTTTTSCPTVKSEPVTTTTKPTTTTRPTEKTCPEGSNVPYVLLVIFLVVVSLCVGGIATWFWMKQMDTEKEVKKPEQAEDADKTLRSLYDAEVKKKGPAAVGTFEKWKENVEKPKAKTLTLEVLELDKSGEMKSKVENEVKGGQSTTSKTNTNI